MGKLWEIPSGKCLHSYGKSSFLMGKSTIYGQFSIANCLFTRGYEKTRTIDGFSASDGHAPTENI